MRRPSVAPLPLAVLSLTLAAACGPGAGGPGGQAGAAAGPVATATACTALLPSFTAAPVDLRFDTGTHTDCSVATTSPAGEVALGFLTTGGTEVRLFSSAGAPQQSPAVASIYALQGYGYGFELDPWFHATATGWAGIVHQFPPPLGFMTWDAAGNPVAVAQGFNAAASAPDAQGGSVVIARDLTANGPHLLWVNAAGQVTRDAAVDRDPVALLVNWSTGHVVVVSREGTSQALARWFDGAGTPLTGWFTTHVVLSGTTALHLLRDGRPALYTDGQWQVAFHDGQTTVDHAPAWLASRPGTRLATIPGGYAVLTDGPLPGTFQASGNPVPKLEVLTAAGASCGVLSPPPDPQPVGGSRQPYAFFVGQDGTLLEGSVLGGTSPDLDMGIHCAFRWWSRLFPQR